MDKITISNGGWGEGATMYSQQATPATTDDKVTYGIGHVHAQMTVPMQNAALHPAYTEDSFLPNQCQDTSLSQARFNMAGRKTDVLAIGAGNWRPPQWGAELQRQQQQQLMKMETQQEDALCESETGFIDKKKARKRVVYIPGQGEDTPPTPCTELEGIQPKQTLKRSLKDQNGIPPGHGSTFCPETITQSVKQQTHDILKRHNKNVANKITEKLTRPEMLVYDHSLLSSFTNLESKGRLSQGSFGVVDKMYDKVTKKDLVMKMVPGQVALNEIEVPLEFHTCPNFTRVAGLRWTGSRTDIIMENAGLSLLKLVRCDQDFVSSLRCPGKLEKIALDIFTAIQMLGKYGISHCDIKPENMCVDSVTGMCKLIDFGSSKTLKDLMTYMGITPEYMTPSFNKFYLETTKQIQRGVKQDPRQWLRLDNSDEVWAGGMVCSFMVKRQHPTIQYFRQVAGGSVPHDDAAQNMSTAERFHIIEKISKMQDPVPDFFFRVPGNPVMEELLRHVLVVDKSKRWQAQDAVRFLQDHLRYTEEPKRKVNKVEPMDVDQSKMGGKMLKVEPEKYSKKVCPPETSGDYQEYSKKVCPPETSGDYQDPKFCPVDVNKNRYRVKGCLPEDPSNHTQDGQDLGFQLAYRTSNVSPATVTSHMPAGNVLSPPKFSWPGTNQPPQQPVKKLSMEKHARKVLPPSPENPGNDKWVWGYQPDNKDNAELIKFFLDSSKSKTTAEFSPSPWQAAPPKGMSVQDTAGVKVTQGTFATQADGPKADLAKGLFGGVVYKFVGGSGKSGQGVLKEIVEPKEEDPGNPMLGNMPQFDVLMSQEVSQDDSEMADRVKIKARRTSRKT